MSRLAEVPNTVSFPDLETRVLARWQSERTFERSLEESEGRPVFVFYDGPPFATGLPHYGHILTSFIKDVVPRYFTMRGYHVPRRWGWDCHGLPVEYEVEKALGLGSRAEIVRHGIDRFNDTCRALVMRYQAQWETIVGRLGRWVDFAGAYKTMDADFMESVVHAFAALHRKGLVYEGRKVVPWCIRCQTALSNFEARLDDAFRPRDDLALTVRFPLAGDGASFLAWTTTPWTLPSNLALAVHPALEYVRVERDGDFVWLAAAALPRYPALGGAIVERRMGAELVGRTYVPPFPPLEESEGAFRVLAADWVSAEDGTGIVHLAPAFGEQDQEVCAAAGITGPNPVRDDGTFDDRVGAFAGMTVFDANPLVARALREAGRVVEQQSYRHSYPHCWRCDTPLIYRAIASWFVRVSSLRERMVEHNREIRWVPEHIGTGRFAEWLANARDWAVSRNRFWGAPVPVWRCDACAEVLVVGSAAELAERSGREVGDWHRPHIDEVVVPCACGGTMRRVPDVLDCWFESGAMPYGQAHYPFADRARFEEAFPGDFIVEYVAQTRGWFYTMTVLSTALLDRPPFRNAVCHGVILAEDGRKMSKRLQNYPDPMALVDEHGSDALRVALLTSGAVAGNDIRFSAASVRDAVRRIHLPLWNALHLYTAYASIDGFTPTGSVDGASRLDRYLLSESEALREAVEGTMARYDLVAAYRAIESFVETLSTWYVRLVKPLLWREGLDAEKRAAYETLHAALARLATVAAPFLPFVAEAVFEALGGADSVHLQPWPAPRDDWRDEALRAEMTAVREVVRLGRRAREASGIRHRQPLRRVLVAGLPAGALEANRALLEGELNVRAVDLLDDVESVVERQVVLDWPRLGKRLRGAAQEVARAVSAGGFAVLADGRLRAAGHEIEADEYSMRFVPRAGGQAVQAEGAFVLVLDVEIDEALLREGYARALNRVLQDLRKRARLAYDQRVIVSVVGDAEALAELRVHEGWLLEQCLGVALLGEALEDPLATETAELGTRAVQVAIAAAR